MALATTVLGDGRLISQEGERGSPIPIFRYKGEDYVYRYGYANNQTIISVRKWYALTKQAIDDFFDALPQQTVIAETTVWSAVYSREMPALKRTILYYRGIEKSAPIGSWELELTKEEKTLWAGDYVSATVPPVTDMWPDSFLEDAYTMMRSYFKE